MQVSGTTHKGLVREGNEDAYLIHSAGEDVLLVLVADGLGGHQAGEVASAHAVAEFKRMAEAREFALRTEAGAWPEQLVAAAHRVHRVIEDDAWRHSDRLGMATTAIAALLTANGGTLLQVGDSRAYSWRGGVLQPMTIDQTVAGTLFRAGRIDRQAYANHPERNQLTQCLGLENWDEPLSPIVQDFALAPGERLLLCSDGLTDMVDDTGVASILAANASVDDAVLALRDAALDAGGHDNVTLVLVEAPQRRRRAP